MRKVFDWVTIGLTFALTISALGVVGSFEQGRLDTAGFFIGQAVCIAGIALLAVIHHLLSKKKKPCWCWNTDKGQGKIYT